MKETELKPCPFCGRTNQKLITQLSEYCYPWFRGRRGIHCECGLFMFAKDNTDAKEKWNRRADNEQRETD